MRNAANTPSQPSAVVPLGDIDSAYTRLHVTPLDPQLLKVIVPPSVLPNIRGLSYHTLQTFPDKPYGFVELPSADAEKIKKKLNGAVLRGSKIRIEPARPDNMPTPSEDAVAQNVDGTEVHEHPKQTKKEKKRKRDLLEAAGIELEEGRKVKRGWTVTPEQASSKKRKEKEGKYKMKKDKEDLKSSSKKDRRKKREPESLYTEGPECLVKTRLPPNKLDLMDNDGGKDMKRAKKEKQRNLLVHEFERNTKFATFLKTANDPAPEQAATIFVEGQGWVTEDGTLVEDVKTTRPIAFPRMQVERRNHHSESLSEDDTSSSSDDTSLEDESEMELDTPSAKRSGPVIEHSSPIRESKGVSYDIARPKSSGSVRSLTINIPSATPSSGNVHPLEALYKRHKKDDAEIFQGPAISEQFTFGDLADDIGDEDIMGPEEPDSDIVDQNKDPHKTQGSQPPMTPFTKKDLEWRTVRSAAPTPDTAHPSRFSRLWATREDGDSALGDVEEDKGEYDQNDEGITSDDRVFDDQDREEPSNKASADFQNMFWERRAELNRSWKKRRRMSAKEKRYRENKARADRAI